MSAKPRYPIFGAGDLASGQVWRFDPLPGKLTFVLVIVLQVCSDDVWTLVIDTDATDVLASGDTFSWRLPLSRGWERIA